MQYLPGVSHPYYILAGGKQGYYVCNRHLTPFNYSCYGLLKNISTCSQATSQVQFRKIEGFYFLSLLLLLFTLIAVIFLSSIFSVFQEKQFLLQIN